MRFRLDLIALVIGSFALVLESVQAFDSHSYCGSVYYCLQPVPVCYCPSYNVTPMVSQPRSAYVSPMDSQPREEYARRYAQQRAFSPPPMTFQPQSAPQRSPTKPTTIINIGAGDNYFDPGSVNVQPGTTVKWVNQGQHKHTVTSDQAKWDSGDLAAGATYSVTFKTPGTYDYHCRHHKEMKGTIVVGPGEKPASPSD
jgi:plastocyanin